MFIQLGAQDYKFTVWHHYLTDAAKHSERMAELFEQLTQVII